MRALLMIGLMMGTAAAQALKPGPPDVVAVETRDMRVEFAGDRAWTMFRILHKGAVVTDKVGFYGTVFAPEGGRWIGTGHNEGGIEKVEQVELKVDGKTCELKHGAVYPGSRGVIEKKSMMGPLRLTATYIVTDDALLERHRYEVTEDVTIGTLYAFMHPWVPATTEWVAQMPDGSMREGTFDEDGGHELKEDVKWTAIFNPALGRAMMAWYPKPLAGQGLKTSFWDKKVYHKQYNQIYSHAAVPKGTVVEAEVVIRGVETKAEGWKDSAKALAAETEKRQTDGTLGW